RGAGEEKSVNHIDAARRAAELRKQYRNDKELVETLKPFVAIAPGYIRPQHSNKREKPEQHRQSAGGGAQFAARIGNVERRKQREQPERGQDLRRGDRPGHRDRDADRKPVGDGRKARAVEPSCRWRGHHARSLSATFWRLRSSSA